MDIPSIIASTDGSSTPPPIFWLIIIVLVVIEIAGVWKAFEKAGRPGWNSIVPVYNNWVMMELGGKPGWWAIVGIIPYVGILALIGFIPACIEIAKRFGKSGAFGFFLLLLFGFIGWPILGFGDAKYTAPHDDGPTGAAPTPAAPAV